MPITVKPKPKPGQPKPIPPPAPAPTGFLPAVKPPVTRKTPFRATGDVPVSVWTDEFRKVSSPVAGSEIEKMWQAAAGISAMVLDRLRIETTYGKHVNTAKNNVLGLRDRTGRTLNFEAFATPTDAVKELVRRWTDPKYKAGVYMPQDLSVEGMLAKYSPPFENDTEALIVGAVEHINLWRGWKEEPAGEVVFGRVPRPSIKDRVIPDKDNIAWLNLGQRKILGIAYHRQLGTNLGTDGWFRMMWQPNGEKGGGQLGLTDYGIDHTTGEIRKWNDPYGVGGAGVSPNRSGHASGGPGGCSGDGCAFSKKYAINRDLASIEVGGWYDTPVSQAGYNAIVALSAHLADAVKIPWHEYPMNPHTGLVFTYWHNEFQGEKPCPGNVIMVLTPKIIVDTREFMKKYQVG